MVKARKNNVKADNKNKDTEPLPDKKEEKLP